MKTLYIIDGYLWVYTSIYAGMKNPLTSPSGEPTTGTYTFTKTLLKLLRDLKPDMLCVAMDSPVQTFRKQLYEDYKNNRKKDDLDGFDTQLKRIEQILKALEIPVYHAPGYEADDIIGTIVDKAYHEFEDNSEVIICTRDKDVLQLLDERYSGFAVKVLDAHKGKITEEKDVLEKYGVRSFQFVDFLALQGDSSDNVPGVPGIGPKKAAALLQEWGGPEAIYNNLDKIGGKLAEKLDEGREMFNLSKDLVTIRRDVPMNFSFDDMVVKDLDWNKLNPIFSELGFQSLVQARTRNRRLF